MGLNGCTSPTRSRFPLGAQFQEGQNERTLSVWVCDMGHEKYTERLRFEEFEGSKWNDQVIFC